MIDLSRHFTLEEATHSQTAERLNIHNQPDPETLAVMIKTAEYMEMVRYKLGNPIIVSSWYRSAALDLALRGGKPAAKRSQHQKGEAVDFICPKFGTPLQVIQRIISNKEWIPYDQLIYEHTWIHISFAINLPRPPRGEVLTLLETGGYAFGLTDRKGKQL